jgi:hypothetical protein
MHRLFKWWPTKMGGHLVTLSMEGGHLLGV